MNRFSICLFSVAVLLPGVSQAAAPLALTSASPSSDSVAQGAPTVVELTFSGKVNPGSCGIQVRDTGGHRYDHGKPYAVNDPQHIAVGLKELLPGGYVVQWNAGGAGAAPVHGTYSFTVQ